MAVRIGLEHLHRAEPDRTSRDRLEILTALINGPAFDPIYRPDVIDIPRKHSVYRWECFVHGCERTRCGGTDFCNEHRGQWALQRAKGVGKAEFLGSATALPWRPRREQVACRICPERPIAHNETQLCQQHFSRWGVESSKAGRDVEFADWLTWQEVFPGYGTCLVAVCHLMACTPKGLCYGHESAYRRDNSPGAVTLPKGWANLNEQVGAVAYADEARYRQWCADAAPLPMPGQINLLGLRPLARAEIKWGLFAHAQADRPTRWDIGWIRSLVATCATLKVDSLVGYEFGAGGCAEFTGSIATEILHRLRLVYYTPEDTREAGFLETEHFGVRLDNRASHIDLSPIPQRWLRDLAWDYLADLFRSPKRPRGGGVSDGIRRAAVELGAFLQVEAPEEGHNPRALNGGHMRRFVADQRHRERDGLPSLGVKRFDGSASIVTTVTRSTVFNSTRSLLRHALEQGISDDIGLDREFITAVPTAGGTVGRTPRRPFPDEVAKALASEENLQRLAEEHDPNDLGLRDIWETVVLTGRRIGEVRTVRLDCLGRYGGLPMFWHDQTKVGNYDVAIRIPERLHALLAERQRKTLDRFAAEHGHQPSHQERADLALFPAAKRNRHGDVPLTYEWFHTRFRVWVDSLDLGHWVPHQARHTLATNLLRAGATLTHIRRYLGHVSDRMAEHYVHLSHSDLEDVLQRVWVAGPGAPNPGELLTDPLAPMPAERARALAVDLSRRSTPAEGGFCTFQPVVDGGSCPWGLNCHSCDKFVLSGADLLYWRRKREQWRQLAEGAPDDTTANYLHQHFEPTARAIDGLEKALAGMGLLDQALDVDLRKPQDYFHRIWSTAFRAKDLADSHAEHVEADDEEVCA